MAELVPVPLPLLLTRAFLEYEREGKIFDLPKAKFFRGLAGLDTAVHFHGQRAATPIGPAAGPHGQLAQNIALSWLAGSRIIELKTVQILDELKIPRPCIDIANVGYNVEWSQELKLEQSLREYVAGVMLIEILKASCLLGEDFPGAWGDTIYDMSVGYNLEGISSPRVRDWIGKMKDATPILDELRASLTGPWARFRDLPFPTRISDTITISTFHGCPAGEIEGIVRFLLEEMGVHVCVKLNPTLLGKPQVEHLLHDVLGYHAILVTEDAFAHDLQFADAIDLLPRLSRVAQACGKRLSVKFSNTLVVKNHRTYFTDEVMYMSGPPLHVITMNLVGKFREATGAAFPTSFSAGVDALNVASAVAMNFVPVTTCTDLLRPGGYGRLIRYYDRLGEKMREFGVTRLPDFVVRSAGQAAAAVDCVVGQMRESFAGSERALGWVKQSAAPLLAAWLMTPSQPLDETCREVARSFETQVAADLPPLIANLEQTLVDTAGLLNTPKLIAEATANPRYAYAQNKGVPRKIGSKLWLYDCINCDKCVPVCPNDANFIYETPATDIAYDNFVLAADGARRVPGGVLKAVKAHQIANYADACNECGNCDVFCPEDGGPYIEKPRFFASIASYQSHAGRNGFFIEFSAEGKTLHAMVQGQAYTLVLLPSMNRARFSNGVAEVEIALDSNSVINWQADAGTLLDMRPYVELKLLLESVSDPRRVNFANAAGLEKEVAVGNQDSVVQR